MTEIAALAGQLVTLFLTVRLAHALGISRGETAGRKRGIRDATAFFEGNDDDDDGGGGPEKPELPGPTAAELERVLGQLDDAAGRS